MTDYEVPRTRVEIRDRSDAPLHKPSASRIFVNGAEVLVERDSLDFGMDRSGQAVAVTLRLLPTELVFTHEKSPDAEPETDPTSDDVVRSDIPK